MMDMMGRKIKYALQMRDGTDVRTIEDLRKHFNLPQVAGYFLDGKLVEWLRDRHYEETANEIEKLKENLKKDDPDLGEKLCTALGVKVEYPEPLDIPAIDARIKKEDKVSQRTRNPLAKAHLDALACNQRDLELLLAQGVTPIYLLGKGEGKTLITYVIPLARAGHRTFIGIEDTYVTFDPMGEGSQLKTAVEKQGIRLEHTARSMASRTTAARTACPWRRSSSKRSARFPTASCTGAMSRRRKTRFIWTAAGAGTSRCAKRKTASAR